MDTPIRFVAELLAHVKQYQPQIAGFSVRIEQRDGISQEACMSAEQLAALLERVPPDTAVGPEGRLFGARTFAISRWRLEVPEGLVPPASFLVKLPPTEP